MFDRRGPVSSDLVSLYNCSIIIIICFKFGPLAQSRRLEDIAKVVTERCLLFVLNVPRKAIAFPLWRAIESHRNRNMDPLGSSVIAVIRIISIIIITTNNL